MFQLGTMYLLRSPVRKGTQKRLGTPLRGAQDIGPPRHLAQQLALGALHQAHAAMDANAVPEGCSVFGVLEPEGRGCRAFGVGGPFLEWLSQLPSASASL